MSYHNSASGFRVTKTQWTTTSTHAVQCTPIQWSNLFHNICPPAVVRIHQQWTLPELPRKSRKKIKTKNRMRQMVNWIKWIKKNTRMSVDKSNIRLKIDFVHLFAWYMWTRCKFVSKYILISSYFFDFYHTTNAWISLYLRKLFDWFSCLGLFYSMHRFYHIIMFVFGIDTLLI